MAKRSKLKFNLRGFEDLRKQPKVRADLVKRAERVKDRASEGGRVDGYLVTDLVLEDPRGAVSVLASGHARQHNRKKHALLRALDAARD